MKSIYIYLLTMMSSVLCSGQTDDRMIILVKPTGNSLNAYPLMEEFHDTSSAYRSVMSVIDSSAIKEFLGVYNISQQFLVNRGSQQKKEPAYLALTSNQGGYAKKGFYLVNLRGDTIDRTKSSYVDIMHDRLFTDYKGLMSFTQLYPHELAHVIYGQVSINDSVDPESRNVDMHYFPVITDYSTAFNEGFAIHFENISRLIENNQDIRAGTQKDLDRIEQSTPIRIHGYLNDIKYPFRLGYFKSSVIMWFQQYEDYRRHVHALDGSIKYINYAPETGSIEDQLTIRNMGILYGHELRNSVQSCATEGMIASLFTKLFQSELGIIYYDKSFYKPFLADTSMRDFNPAEHFTPFENLFIKYFLVLHNYVSKFNTSRVQVLDFLHGYKELFPKEKHVLDSVYYLVSGHSIPDDLPPQIWMMVKNYEHRMLAIDPFGAATIQTYTFDLNAADKTDLLTIPGLSDKDAESITAYRKNNGLFTEIGELNNIENLSSNGKSILLESVFDKEYFYSIPEPSLSFSAIKFAPLKSYLKRVLIYLGILLLLLNIFLLKKQRWIRRIWISFRYFLLWILLSSIGAAAVIMINSPLLWVGAVIIALHVITILIYRRKHVLLRSLIMMGIMGLIVIISLL